MTLSHPIDSLESKKVHGSSKKGTDSNIGNYSSMSAVGDREGVNTTQSQTNNAMHSLTEINPNQSLFLVDESKID